MLSDRGGMLEDGCYVVVNVVIYLHEFYYRRRDREGKQANISVANG